jgi:hypothetical protein
VELLLAVAEVGPDDTVLDPTCGSGGFLVCAARRGARVRGIERDPLLAELARVNLRLARVVGEVARVDFFAAAPEPVDVVVANPPFSVAIADTSTLERYDLGRGRKRQASDALFVEALERWVRPGGRAAIVLPWSILVNASRSDARARLLSHWAVDAVCGLPEGVFRPFGGAAGRACLLWLRRGAPSRCTRWAEIRDPGWDVRSRHLRKTSSQEVASLAVGSGWVELPHGCLVPEAQARGGQSRALRTLARARFERRTPSRDPEKPFVVVDLADVDKRSGEVLAPRVEKGGQIRGAKLVLRERDLLVSRLRPELAGVALVAGDMDKDVVGSTEWVVLEPDRWPHYLLHALRTSAWRAGLPVTQGQTRPRTTVDAILESAVPWPGEPVAARVDSLARRLHEERARVRERLAALETALERFAAGAITEEELATAVQELECRE